MSIPACFSEIIGFVRKADNCVAGYIADYSNSDSGLYISELQGMALRILNSTGGNYGIWEKMANARENAVAAFKIDVLNEILKTKEPARSKFIGDIGGKSFTTKLAAATYHGLRMYSDIIGGSYTLRGVSLILDNNAGATLTIYDEYGIANDNSGVAIAPIALLSTAGQPKYTKLSVSVQLSLSGNYYFLYTTPSGGVPYNNKLTCNCGGFKWCFNPFQPCYKVSRDKWTEWAMVAGVSGDSLPLREDWGTQREAQGLILHGNFGCDTLGILCSDHSDWTGDTVDNAIAWAILFKAGSFLSAYIMDSEEVSRYTLLGVDGLTANMVYYEERYKVMIEFIAANIEEDRNECLRCRSPHGFKRQTQML